MWSGMVADMGEKTYQDMTLVCKDCGKEFLFAAEEQEFYAEKGFRSRPQRCKECRKGRRQEKLYEAVCAACGRKARVPFPPDADRLVYCGDCYAQIRAERAEWKN